MADSGRLDELQRKFDENPRRYFAPLANEYRKGGDVERAIELCRTYLPHLPGHMSGYIVYGQALFDAKRGQEAAAIFQEALRIGIRGWVKNCSDGTVEIDAEGPAPQMKQFVEEVKKGSPVSKVTHLEIRDEVPTGFQQFEIRY